MSRRKNFRQSNWLIELSPRKNVEPRIVGQRSIFCGSTFFRLVEIRLKCLCTLFYMIVSFGLKIGANLDVQDLNFNYQGTNINERSTNERNTYAEVNYQRLY